MKMTQRTSLQLGARLRVKGPDGFRDIDIYTEEGFRILANLWTRSNWQHKLSYEVTWLGIPVIQLPEDLLMMQEIIYKVRPDVIVETGTAHGGTAVFYASMLELLGKGQVISIDIEIRKYNRLAIQAHPMSKRITLMEGNSTAEAVVTKVRDKIGSEHKVLWLWTPTTPIPMSARSWRTMLPWLHRGATLSSSMA